MFEFKRGLSTKFVDLLNAEYDRGGWWESIANDPSLVIGIRDEYLNVYWKGSSLIKLWMQGDTLAGEVHYKYLLRPEISTSPYLKIEAGQLRSEISPHFFLSDFSDTASLKRAADVHATGEKSGVHNIVMSNPNVIDVEVAFGAENEKSGEPVIQRIDFVALQHGKGGPELTFFEAKMFTNRELRAKGKAVPVLGQLERYRTFLRSAKTELAESYSRVCSNLVSLKGVMNRFCTMHGVLRSISDGTCGLGISDDVRLVVFGYDRDQEKGLIWKGHREKLRDALGRNLLLKGKPADFTNGISAAR